MSSSDVDPQLRLQIIAIEATELQGQRQMSWSEATSRASMLMTVVGAAVVAIALVGQATAFDRSFLLFALFVLPVVLVVGLSTLGRINELNIEDWRWVQGLNRLRHARLELDPSLAHFLVNSRYDDARGVLQAYAGQSASRLHGLAVLPTLIGLIDALLAGFLAAVILLNVGVDGGVAAVGGTVVFLVAMVSIGVTGYRAFVTATARFEVKFPSSPDLPVDV